jgi:hypothetical protein
MVIIRMGKVRNRFCVVSAVLLALLAGLAGSANAMILDWDGVAWTPGSLNNSYNLNGDAFNDITVAITSQNPGIFANDPTTGTQTPTINQSITGGLTPVENSLMIAANLHTNSNLTVQLSFAGGPGGLPGANNVSFTIFDIDITTNSDIISSIYGVAPDGTHIAATITNVGPAVTLSGSGLTYTLTGNAASPNNSSNGNVTISFGSTLIYDVFFTFGNTAGAPRYQDIAIGDVTFTPVPEVNPAAVAAGSCVTAIGLTIFLQRRARRRQTVR